MLEETPELAYNGGDKGCLGSYRNSFWPSKLIYIHLFTPMPLRPPESQGYLNTHKKEIHTAVYYKSITGKKINI